MNDDLTLDRNADKDEGKGIAARDDRPAGSLQVDAGSIQALLNGRLGDPFRLLGPHRVAGSPDMVEIRVYQPGALEIEVLARGARGSGKAP